MRTPSIISRSSVKRFIPLCLGCAVLLTACKKKETETTAPARFDYTVEAETQNLFSFPIAKDMGFTLQVKSGTTQDVTVSIKAPEGFAFSYKEGVVTPYQTVNTSISYTKPMLPGSYPYTIETSSPGTEPKTFAGNIVVPKEDCAKEFKGAFRAKETYKTTSVVDSVREYTVNLIQDPVYTNFVTLENFRNDPSLHAKVIFQCNTIQGRFSSPPTCYLYETNFPDSIRMSHTQHTGTQFVLLYTVTRDGKSYTCSTIYEKL